MTQATITLDCGLTLHLLRGEYNNIDVCQTEVVKWHEANAVATRWVCVGKQQCSDFNVECTVVGGRRVPKISDTPLSKQLAGR